MPDMERERDLVLNPNEFAYVLDKTKGLISCVVGSYKMSLSTSDSLVVFNKETKKFEEATFSEAISTFVTAPENWYIELKNPAKDNNKHPTPGTANPATDLLVGKKVNIPGNATFALYPGQMAKTIRGHRLHSNQYLLARVYDADVLENSQPEKVDDPNKSYTEELDDIMASDNPETKKYTVGQLLVIKGTEVPFYIPPTGIEVIPKGGSGTEYVRDAVTLERLEYCILKNESGNKKYIHGPSVVFPEPDEVFITNPETNDYKFRAIELSEIMGLYIKVISDYTENDKQYHAGEELFITGADQMIYYPRPEHAIIDYEGKIAHHAIAIPRGEGRYVLNRKTGNIKMVTGPTMYLPDPRDEVVVKRKLSKRECELWYPGNSAVLEYNTGISQDDLGTAAVYCATSPERFASTKALLSTARDYIDSTVSLDSLENGFLGKANVSTDKNSRISRGNKYSKPRTITIDNKFDGVVSIDVWTGYAINVVSKEGTRKVVVGPKTYLLEYDETLEALTLSTGKPKTTDNICNTVYLRVENNKISDIANAQTSDFVDVSIKLSYCLDFKLSHKDKWFSIDNYVKFLTDRMRSLLKREVRQHTIEDFYNNSTDIVRNVVVGPEDESGKVPGKMFNENGMFVYDVEVLSVKIDDPAVDSLIKEHQTGIVQKSLELTNASKEIEVAKKLAEVEETRQTLEHKNRIYALNLKTEYELKEIDKIDTVRKMQEKSDKEMNDAKLDLQETLNQIVSAELERSKEKSDYELSVAKERSAIKVKDQESYAEAVEKIISAVSEDLAASLVSRSNAEMLKEVANAISPYALANGQSVPDAISTLLRGTPLDTILRKVNLSKE